jgi:hypothetical protein
VVLLNAVPDPGWNYDLKRKTLKLNFGQYLKLDAEQTYMYAAFADPRHNQWVGKRED